MKPLTSEEIGRFVQAIPASYPALHVNMMANSREAYETWQAQSEIGVCIKAYKVRMGMVQTAGRA